MGSNVLVRWVEESEASSGWTRWARCCVGRSHLFAGQTVFYRVLMDSICKRSRSPGANHLYSMQPRAEQSDIGTY